MSSFPEAELAVQRFAELVDRYYFDSDEDTRTVITNITGLTRSMGDVFAWYARELDHWARAARDAEAARDDLAARVQELEAELVEARSVADRMVSPDVFGDAMARACQGNGADQ